LKKFWKEGFLSAIAALRSLWKSPLEDDDDDEVVVVVVVVLLSPPRLIELFPPGAFDTRTEVEPLELGGASKIEL